MKSILAIISMFSFFVALIIFFQFMQNAFKKSFAWGIVAMLFPIGSFIYYKKFINEEKKSVINFIIPVLIGSISFLIAKII